MSIKVLKIRDPRLDIEPDRTYVATIGGSNITTKSYTSDTANNSQIVWSITTPSVRVGMDRHVDLDITVRLTCTGSATLVAGWENVMNAGLRQFPLHSICEVINCRLNDQAFSWEPAQTVHALCQYGQTVEDRQYWMASTGHKPDTATDYVTSALDVGNRNPFSRYFNSGDEDGRGFEYYSTSPAPGVIEVRIVESLMLSPFLFGPNQHQALFGIQNFDLSLTLANVEKFFAGSGAAWSTIFTLGSAANLVAEVVQEGQKMHLTFITPQPDVLIPKLLHYPYYQVKRFTQNCQQAYRGKDKFTETFGNITLHEIPKRMYIYGRPRVGTSVASRVTQADYFLGIERLVCNFDNQDGRLSTLDSLDLFKLSVKNGLKRSYLSFNKVLGSVLCIEFGTDLSLSPLLCPGIRGNFQLSLDVEFRDVRPSTDPAVDYNMYLVIVPEGVMTINDQLVSISIGCLTEEILSQTDFAPAGFRHQLRDHYGGGFFSNLWSGLKKVFQTVAPVARDISGVVGTVSGAIPHPMAQGVGQGSAAVNRVLSAMGQGLEGGRKKRGGARMRTSSLAHRL